MGTIFNPVTSDLRKLIVEFFKSDYRHIYLFARKQRNGYGVTILQATGKRNKGWKRYVITEAQMDSFEYMAGCVNAKIYYLEKEGDVNVLK